MGLTQHPSLGAGSPVSAGETAPIAPPPQPIDPLRSETGNHPNFPDTPAITRSLMDATQAAYLPVPTMPDVIEFVPNGDRSIPLMRSGVVGRVILLEPAVDELPFDTSNVTIDAVIEALHENKLALITTVYLGDGRRTPSVVAEEGFKNNPEITTADFVSGLSTRTVHVGTQDHFPLPIAGKPASPKPAEGMAVIGPPAGSGDQNLEIGTFLYDKERNFVVRKLSPDILKPLQNQEAAIGLWMGVGPDGKMALFGRDSFLPVAGPSITGPLVLIETGQKIAHIPADESPIRMPKALKQLGQLGFLGSAAPSVPDAEPPPPMPPAANPSERVPAADAADAMPDLIEVGISRPSLPDDVLEKMRQEQREKGYIVTNGSSARRPWRGILRGRSPQ